MSTSSSTVVDSIPTAVHEALATAERLMDQRLWAEAHDRLSRVRDELAGIGIESPYLAWLCAVASHSSGRLAEAVVHIARARALDPASSQARRSEEIIVSHVLAVVEAAGAEDLFVRLLVQVVRRQYVAGHPVPQRLDEKLAGMAKPPAAEDVSAVAPRAGQA